METFFRSVGLKADRCKGCVSCIKRCPTEAIRIREGKAHIIESKCIDCGECIRVCPNQAKFAITNHLEDTDIYKYNIALPAPSLFSQFELKYSVEAILCGLLRLGFDDVYEVAKGAEIVAFKLKEYLQQDGVPKPVISNACPACVRLMQISYPELIPHLLPYEPPVEVAARIARKRALENNPHLQSDDIGVWFIGPCPAKMTAVVHPLTEKNSNLNGVIAVSTIYGKLHKTIPRTDAEFAECESRLGDLARWGGVTWGVAGGESDSVDSPRGTGLIVHGIHHVKEMFEQLSDMKLTGVEHVEVLACESGCVGGALMVQNRFVGEHNLRTRIDAMKTDKAAERFSIDGKNLELMTMCESCSPVKIYQPAPIDEDMSEALRKVEQMEQVLKQLPGLDCGSCGSPTCKVLAEDIIRGFAAETDCIFKLREKVRDMARAMVDLAEHLPPSFEKSEEKSNDC